MEAYDRCIALGINHLYRALVLYRAAQTEHFARKKEYATQMTLICLFQVWVFLAITVFLPRGAVATSDSERGRIVIVAMITGAPFMSLASYVCRSVKQGHPLTPSLLLNYITFSYLIVPRLMQAKMERLSSKALNSFLFAMYDFVTDTMQPYRILMFVGSRRWARARLSALKARHGETSADRRASFSRGDSGLLRQVSMSVAFATQSISPRYMRAVADQVSITLLTESTVMIFADILEIIAKEVSISPSSSAMPILEKCAGILVLITIEAFMETILITLLVRLHNLPVLRAERERGVMWLRIVVLWWTAQAMTLFLFFYLVRGYTGRVASKQRFEEIESILCPYVSPAF
ncbi:unnamed protein product [Vitrella brassicaformis CCMP3155]|uniref:Uncharacterized protein n=1 Tax=Vitrella brassicaformis (strain CCMP3155) TaxID=1169540 RepID=A0A0G4EE66_VITBC|nr:unnamed protein product [Vitrella brassicaformis CCMP3155]|eukprot:CEL93658.1 unnamed protein product [Vitrella brassicaformis CCMP3155]